MDPVSPTQAGGILRHRTRFWRCLPALALWAAAPEAWAQRAVENAFDNAEDAFGTRVGSEGVGLYSSRDARGFDPNQAGNMRVEGLYFDQQAGIGPRIQRSSAMHVGISAQSYPFPAPTGISDMALIMPANRTIYSLGVQRQDLGGTSMNSFDVSTPVTDTLGLIAGIVYSLNINEYGGHNTNFATAGLARWKPTDNIEVIPLWYYTIGVENQVQPQIFPAGNFLPPKYHRRRFFGQEWAKRGDRNLNVGVIARGNPAPNWRLQLGVFRSDAQRPFGFSVFYRNTQQDGTANLDVLSLPKGHSTSTSGEARASGIFTQGNYRHTIHMAVRGRYTDRLFGGAGSHSFGTGYIGIYTPMPEPTYTFGLRDRDLVRQITPGISYVGQWARVAEFSVGLQKSFYRREFGRENVAPQLTTARPWLYNGTVSITPIDRLAIYAGYTRGIEEFGTAPENAVNRGQPMAADLTWQVDAGIQYRLAPGLNLVAGVFEVNKPYFDRDTANVFTRVGDRKHQGIEASMTGAIAPGLTVVAGAVLIKARVSGSSVDRGIIGNVPQALPASVYTLGVQYGPASWKGHAVDSQFKHTAGYFTNRTNTLRVPATFSWDIGYRYNFRALGAAMNFRAQVFNVTNQFDWRVDFASGSFSPTPPRRYVLRIAADF